MAWPIAKLLDAVLGTHEQHTYKKAELKSFLQFHRTGDDPLRDDELTILNSVLELNTKKVDCIMTPLAVRLTLFLIHPFFLNVSLRMRSYLLPTLFWTTRQSMQCRFVAHSNVYDFHLFVSMHSGYSRFPVHEQDKPDTFIGILLVKTVSFIIKTIPSVRLIKMQLLAYDPKMALPVSSFPLSVLPEAPPSVNCFQALDYLYAFDLNLSRN